MTFFTAVFQYCRFFTSSERGGIGGVDCNIFNDVGEYSSDRPALGHVGYMFVFAVSYLSAFSFFCSLCFDKYLNLVMIKRKIVRMSDYRWCRGV